MTLQLLNCIVGYAAVYATLSVHEHYFESLTLLLEDIPHLAVDQSGVGAAQR